MFFIFINKRLLLLHSSLAEEAKQEIGRVMVAMLGFVLDFVYVTQGSKLAPKCPVFLYSLKQTFLFTLIAIRMFLKLSSLQFLSRFGVINSRCYEKYDFVSFNSISTTILSYFCAVTSCLEDYRTLTTDTPKQEEQDIGQTTAFQHLLEFRSQICLLPS